MTEDNHDTTLKIAFMQMYKEKSTKEKFKSAKTLRICVTSMDAM